MSTGTALARIEPQATAEKIPAAETLTIPAAILLAAESVSAKPGGPKTYLEGVYLHARGERGRVVGTDGARLFLASFQLPTKTEGGCPSWMRDGVIISNDGLRARIALLGKLSEENTVRVTYAKGNASVELSDPAMQTVSKVASLAGNYPDYEKILGSNAFTGLDENGEVESREWQPVGINSSYLKQCGDIASTLEKGLDREQKSKSKLGMVVRAYGGNAADSPMVFDFSTWPGAILVVAPAVMATKVASKETVQLLAPALKATVAALRAHATRWDVKARDAELEHERQEAKLKADGFRQRISNVLRTNPGSLLAGKSKEAKEAKPVSPEPAPPAPEPVAPAPGEPEAPEAPEPTETPEPEPEPAKGPKSKRTRIHLNGAAAA